MKKLKFYNIRFLLVFLVVELFFDTIKTVKHFSKARHSGKKVKQEIVVPIRFEIQNFSRYRNPNYYMYYFNSSMFQCPIIPSAVYTF